MPYSTVSFRMTLSDLEWLSKIFNDIKRCAVSLWQLSFLFSVSACFARLPDHILYVRMIDEVNLNPASQLRQLSTVWSSELRSRRSTTNVHRWTHDTSFCSQFFFSVETSLFRSSLLSRVLISDAITTQQTASAARFSAHRPRRRRAAKSINGKVLLPPCSDSPTTSIANLRRCSAALTQSGAVVWTRSN